MVLFHSVMELIVFVIHQTNVYNHHLQGFRKVLIRILSDAGCVVIFLGLGPPALLFDLILSIVLFISDKLHKNDT
jgi:hypothetical protein